MNPAYYRHRETGEICSGGFRVEEIDQWEPLYRAPAAALPAEPTPEMIAEGWRAAATTIEWTHEAVRYLWERMARAAGVELGCPLLSGRSDSARRA